MTVVIAASPVACKSSSPSDPLDAPAGTSGESSAGKSGMSGGAGAAGRLSSAGASGQAGGGASGRGGAGAGGRGGAGLSAQSGAGASGRSGAGAAGGTAGAAAGSGGTISQWHSASLTNFTSYPDPGSEECIEFNGCMWAGEFAGLDGKQTEEWVMSHNIVAVHSKDFDAYKLKTLRLRKDGKEIDVTVYDECADSDCSGCCTQNAKPSGFLIDVEHYTSQRFGVSDGQVQWACLDCN